MSGRLGRILHWTLLAAGLLLPTLFNVGYKPITSEVAAFLLFSLSLGSVGGILLDPVSRTGQIATAVILVIWLHVYFPLYFPSLLYCAESLVLAATVFLFTHGFLARITAISLAAAVIGSALQAPTAEYTLIERPGMTGAGPPVIHILLDEHASNWGMPSDIFTDGELDRLSQPFVDRGFLVFDRGFSREGVTQRSFAAMMNPGIEPDMALSLSDDHWILERADLLKRIAEERKLDVTGISFLDLSSTLARISNVAHYSIQNIAVAPSSLGEYGVSTLDRLKFAAAATVTWLAIGKKVPAIRALLDLIPGVRDRLQVTSRMYTVTALETLHRLPSRIRQHGRGTYNFAHLLLPHYPYSFRPDCTIRPPAEWQSRIADAPEDTIETRRERYRRYFDQAKCLHTRLLTMLDGLLASSEFHDAVVIIHGDHGSRIAFRDRQAWLRTGGAAAEFERDWRAAFIAVRIPGTAGARVTIPANIAELFRLIVENDFARLPLEKIRDRDPTLGE